MAQHQAECDVCTQIELCREGEHPRFIAELESGFVVLGPHQYWRGYTMLLCNEPATELDELEPGFRRQYLEDMARVAAAVRRVMQPHKLNYEALGNQCHHLHWHVFPRYTDEPSPWEPVWKVMPEDFSPYNFDPAGHGDIILAIRAQLGRSH